MTDLQFVHRVNSTEASEPDLVKQFPDVFQGLGTIGEEYTVKTKPNATPYALYVPRNIPIPLRPKVKEELNRMDKMTRVNTPAPWCTGMVVVPKKSGAVRICVDLKPLNESGLREPDTLALLAGATHFRCQ